MVEIGNTARTLELPDISRLELLGFLKKWTTRGHFYRDEALEAVVRNIS
jgi:hypothetical protein